MRLNWMWEFCECLKTFW